MNGLENPESAARRSLESVERRIHRACEQAGRPTDAVRLLAVGKTFPAERLLALAAAGQRDFGENYLQEALDKQDRCAALAPEARLAWHYIGPVQSNKTRPIAERFDWVHSVDRERIARRLAEQRPEAAGPLSVCLQVNVDDEDSKSGCTPRELPALAAAVAAMPRLRLRGLMAIPAPREDFDRQRRAFAAVRMLFEQLRDAGYALDTLSMGMSADLEAAIAEGATIVRIGTALFGERPRKQE
ncbi:MAG: YggS family pyridoxal phosphate-dependent enzyme [Burkholderiaceae bacterium]